MSIHVRAVACRTASLLPGPIIADGGLGALEPAEAVRERAVTDPTGSDDSQILPDSDVPRAEPIDAALDMILGMFRSGVSPGSPIPPALLYNEGWLLRLVLAAATVRAS
jgi:hypothetical protein